MDYSAIISQLHASGNYRTIPAPGAGTDGVVDFSSNDYLGLAARPELQAEFMACAANRAIPLTSSASRLLAAGQQEYARLEAQLEELYPGRAALIFNSGYHANTGLLAAIADRHSLIISDRLVHASMIDGILLSRAEHLRFPHNDFAALRRLLARHAAHHSSIIIAVESVYSMDGDRADLDELLRIKADYPDALLYVDEAHAFGVRGDRGLGLAAGLSQGGVEVDVIVGTFGKAAASSGAFAAMRPVLKEVAVNRARSFIFSTALPPICAAWTSFIIERMTAMDAERAHLLAMGRRLAEGVPALAGRASHIVPFIVGSADRALELSRQLLREEGLKVLPIRTPTVPAGTERLRISLSAAHTAEQIDHLIQSLNRLSN